MIHQLLISLFYNLIKIKFLIISLLLKIKILKKYQTKYHIINSSKLQIILKHLLLLFYVFFFFVV